MCFSAEYGFSERDLESSRSNLLCLEGAGAVKETSPAKKRSSSKAQDCLVLDCDIANKSKQSLLKELARDPVHSEDNGQTGSTIQMKKHIRDESQSLKIAIDNQYDKDDSVLEENANSQTSTPTTPRYMSNAVPRKRLKRSIQRVNEWLQKTSEFLNASPWNEELLSEVFPELDVDDVSDKDSCMSGETEIMTAFNPAALLDAVKKPVNVQDTIFGKVYKREKKSNTVPKITVVASVHVDGNADSQKIKEIPERLLSGLQPNDFIKRVEATEENSYMEDQNLLVGWLVANDILLNDKKESNPASEYLDNDLKNPKETKLGTRAIPLKRESESALNTRTRQSLLLIKSSDLSMDKDGPFNHSEIKINTYPSSNELGNENNQRNVRRSKRLNLSKKSDAPPIKKLTVTSDKTIKNIEPDGVLTFTETTFQTPQMCNVFNGSSDQITPMLSPNGKIAPYVKNFEINTAHPECETSDGGFKEHGNKQIDPKRNVLWTEDIDSDADTQHLIKAFKSAKRMSFKLEVSDIDIKHSDTINPADSKTNLPHSCQDEIALTMLDKQEQVIYTSNSILSSGYLERNVVSEGIVLSLANETGPYPIITQSPSPVRREDTRSVSIQGENEHVKKDFYQKHSFHEEQINQIMSDNSSQGSVAEKLLECSMSHQNSLLKSPNIYSDTPDGLLCVADRPCVKTNCAEVEKSFVFAKEQKVLVSGGSKSSINESQLIKRKNRKAQKLESSEEESSEDEELPCFNKFLFGNTSNSADHKNASSDCSPKPQGGGVLAMFSSYSTSAKSQTSLNLPKETLASQESVNLFSSPSNTSDNSTNVPIEQELEHYHSECQKNSQRKDTFCKNGQVQDYEGADNFYEDSSRQQDLGTV